MVRRRLAEDAGHPVDIVGMWARITAVAAAALLAAAPASGAPLPTKKAGVLTVAIELGNPGFAQGTVGNPHGFSVDVA